MRMPRAAYPPHLVLLPGLDHHELATSRTYVSRLLAKLGARDRAALVVLAYETGLVRPGR